MGVPISNLPETTTLSENAVFPLVDNGETLKIAKKNLALELGDDIMADYVVKKETKNVNVTTVNGASTVQGVWHTKQYKSGAYEAFGHVTFSNGKIKMLNQQELIYFPLADTLAGAPGVIAQFGGIQSGQTYVNPEPAFAVVGHRTTSQIIVDLRTIQEGSTLRNTSGTVTLYIYGTLPS